MTNKDKKEDVHMFNLESYRDVSTDELKERVAAAKETLGKRLMILGHYYEQDDVIAFADATGDSYALAKSGASNGDAEFIVFCGVCFMAEVSHILRSPGQRVFMPDPDAGCPLADMADEEQVERAWARFESLGIADRIVPMTYVNSSAEIKAFCGKRGGTCCTSSSAGHAFDWALKQKSKIFFLPDENLGCNTAHAKGFADDSMVAWDPTERDGGVDPELLKEARVILWKGYCHVHTYFTRDHVRAARKRYPGCLVAVHPECSPEVVDSSDANGSTSFLIDYARNAPPGSTVVVGTEINLVSRMARDIPGRTVVPLARSLCPNMFKTSLRDLCSLLEGFPESREILVPEYIQGDARLALERMLALK
jgi:quinolinate synthase